MATLAGNNPIVADGTYTVEIIREGWYRVAVFGTWQSTIITVQMSDEQIPYDGFDGMSADDARGLLLPKGTLEVVAANTGTAPSLTVKISPSPLR